MKHYNQLSTKDRQILATLYNMGNSVTYIARQLGRHRSTIHRELSRNRSSGSYSATSA